MHGEAAHAPTPGRTAKATRSSKKGPEQREFPRGEYRRCPQPETGVGAKQCWMGCWGGCFTAWRPRFSRPCSDALASKSKPKTIAFSMILIGIWWLFHLIMIMIMSLKSQSRMKKCIFTCACDYSIIFDVVFGCTDVIGR